MDGVSEFGSRFRRRFRRRSTKDDDDNMSEASWPSRPSTKDSMTSYATSGRLSTDSGAGSLDDFNRRGTTPLPTTFLDFWDGVRRHTAPPRKTSVDHTSDDTRPNTVHAWNVFPSRGTMSRYTPLPSIGMRPEHLGNPRYCFQENKESLCSEDSQEEEDNLLPDYEIPEFHADLVDSLRACSMNEDRMIFRRSMPKDTVNMNCLSIESEFDSDFDEESESCIIYASDDEDDDGQKSRKPVVRSATFTIEDKRPELDTVLLLAVRLPDGTRVSGKFTARDTLGKVCEIALNDNGLSVDKYELATTEIPKRIFSDFSMSLQAAGIADKTLLNLQICDDSEGI